MRVLILPRCPISTGDKREYFAALRAGEGGFTSRPVRGDCKIPMQVSLYGPLPGYCYCPVAILNSPAIRASRLALSVSTVGLGRQRAAYWVAIVDSGSSHARINGLRVLPAAVQSVPADRKTIERVRTASWSVVLLLDLLYGASGGRIRWPPRLH